MAMLKKTNKQGQCDPQPRQGLNTIGITISLLNKIDSFPPWIKWPPFRRRKFHMHFREWHFCFISCVGVLCRRYSRSLRNVTTGGDCYPVFFFDSLNHHKCGDGSNLRQSASIVCQFAPICSTTTAENGAGVT